MVPVSQISDSSPHIAPRSMTMISVFLATLLTAAGPASAQLNSLAKGAGLLYFGTAVDNPSLSNSAYTAIAFNSSEFGQVTPANGQKWDSIQPSQNTFNYANGDAITTKARAAGQILRCHNLVWYNQLPSWGKFRLCFSMGYLELEPDTFSVSGGSWTTSSLQSVLTTHITNEVTHYKGQCYAWDVVNEALDDSGNYRTDVFYNILGTGYIPFAFKAAAAADPSAKLYYNDYNIEYAGVKATAAINIVKGIQAAGGKIDGVGLQGHFIVGSTPSKTSLISALQSFTALGVEVAYTELDIRHSSVPASASAQQQQATDYVTVVSACLSVKNCVGVTVWDFDDQVRAPFTTHMLRISGAGRLIVLNFHSIPGCPQHSPGLVRPTCGRRIWQRSQPILASQASSRALPQLPRQRLLLALQLVSPLSHQVR